MEIIEEKKYVIKTDKNNEMELYLRNYNNEELSFSLFSINQSLSKKYELKCNLEEFQRNRFFKIFINIEEIIKELEKKIEHSKFIEDSNCIIIEIKIGLIIINEIILVIEEDEKSNEEKINELSEKNEKLKEIINNLTTEKEKLLNNIQQINNKYQSEIERLKYELDENLKKEKENIQQLNNKHQSEIKKLEDKFYVKAYKIKQEEEKKKNPKKDESELKSILY